MILVRNIFQARWGQAAQLAQMMTESMSSASGPRPGKWRVLTDLSGPFHTVVMELEVPSLAEWERARAEMFRRPESQATFQKSAGLIEGGRLELYTIEGEGERGSGECRMGSYE